MARGGDRDGPLCRARQLERKGRGFPDPLIATGERFHKGRFSERLADQCPTGCVLSELLEVPQQRPDEQKSGLLQRSKELE